MTLNEKALMLHEQWQGKVETVSASPLKNREDLAMAYTPGVAEPCRVIAQHPEAVYKYTMKGNTVAVISDGSAVLGLGNIGPYAAMPVMEGKCLPVQGVRRRECRADLSGHPGHRGDHPRGESHCPGLWRHQSGGYLRAPLF